MNKPAAVREEGLPECHKRKPSGIRAVSPTKDSFEKKEPFADLWEARIEQPGPKAFTSSSLLFLGTPPQTHQEPPQADLTERDRSGIEEAEHTPERTESWIDSLPQNIASRPPEMGFISSRSRPGMRERKGERSSICRHDNGWRRGDWLLGGASNPCIYCGQRREWKEGHVYNCRICQARICARCYDGLG
jgi:hypothetical protein